MAYSMTGLLARASQVTAFVPPLADESCSSLRSMSLSGSLSASLSLAVSLSSAGGDLLLSDECEDDSVGDFDATHVLGVGAFGRVYLVRHRESGAVLTAKVVRKEHVVRSGQLGNLKREVEVLSALDSELAVEFLGTFQSAANVYVMTRFVPGGELMAHLRGAGAFDLDTAAFYVAEMAVFLDDLHATGIAYCDVKPENILLSDTGHIRVCDFGFAIFLSDADAITPAPRGTPEYMSPEMASSGAISPAADWWSLGVLALELTTGSTLWPAGTDPQLIIDALANYELPALDPRTLPAVAALLDTLLARTPSARYSSLDALGEAPFFESVAWGTLASGLGPIIPSLAAPDDTCNFPTTLEFDALDWSCDEPGSDADVYAEQFANFF